MCPACVATAGMVVSGAVSTGGVTALVLRVFRKKKNETSDLKKQGKEQ
jgi:hypothetical protein